MLIISPLKIELSKKRGFILNLNNYRNTHYYTLNSAKVAYKELVTNQLTTKFDVPIKITYTYFPKTKRRVDIGNVLSIHQKFFEDALVEGGCIPDDSYDYLPEVAYRFGEIDKDNPRVEILVEVF